MTATISVIESELILFEMQVEGGMARKNGFIDHVYFDEVKGGWVIVNFKMGKPTDEKEAKYQEQLDFYRGVLEAQGERVIETRLLWL